MVSSITLLSDISGQGSCTARVYAHATQPKETSTGDVVDPTSKSNETKQVLEETTAVGVEDANNVLCGRAKHKSFQPTTMQMSFQVNRIDHAFKDLVLLHMLPKRHLVRCIACSHIFPYGSTVHIIIKGCKLILGTLLCSSLMYRQHVFCPLVFPVLFAVALITFSFQCNICICYIFASPHSKLYLYDECLPM